jgi:hypothetical protein
MSRISDLAWTGLLKALQEQLTDSKWESAMGERDIIDQREQVCQSEGTCES